jgi:hypothetical protein
VADAAATAAVAADDNPSSRSTSSSVSAGGTPAARASRAFARLDHMVHDASDVLPHQGILTNFVHHNPFFIPPQPRK